MRHALGTAVSAFAACAVLTVGLAACSSSPDDDLGQSGTAEAEWVSASYSFHNGDGMSSDWRSASYSLQTARDQVSGWAGLDDDVIEGRLKDACGTLEAHDPSDISDVQFLPALIAERQATGAPDVVRSLEEAKAVMRHATALYCPDYTPVFKPEQLQPTGEPDLHFGAIDSAFLLNDVPSLMAKDDVNSDKVLDSVCYELENAKKQGEPGDDAVHRLTKEMTEGKHFDGTAIKYAPEARNLQLYSVTFRCPVMGAYVGDAIYPGF